MPSSKIAVAALLLAVAAPAARAQRPVQGFAVERLYPSAAGGGWFVMDALDQHGGLGGALALTLGYAANPLRVTDGTQHLAVVSDQAFAGVAAAITWDRWRAYLNFDMPLVVAGDSATIGGYSFAGPSLSPGSNPDVISDARLGVDARIVGRAGDRFRLGAGAQLLVPFGSRSDYVTDDTFRGMLRALAAGDARWLSWAAQLGVHIRPLDDSPTAGSPKGSELLLGVAGGARLRVPRCADWAIVVGPELFAATAFRSFFGSGTALEGLLGARIEGTRDDRPQLRIKLAVGAGLYQHFGAAQWRVVLGVELFGQRRGRSK